MRLSLAIRLSICAVSSRTSTSPLRTTSPSSNGASTTRPSRSAPADVNTRVGISTGRTRPAARTTRLALTSAAQVIPAPSRISKQQRGAVDDPRRTSRERLTKLGAVGKFND